jgi:hypothetical protein
MNLVLMAFLIGYTALKNNQVLHYTLETPKL